VTRKEVLHVALMEELLGIENALAGGSGDQYRRHLGDDAVGSPRDRR